jgi:hypothetical protein
MGRQKAEVSNYSDVFSRLKISVEAETDAALAKALEISQASVAAVKRKQQIPPGWIMKIATEFDISADWLLFGVGEMVRAEGEVSLGLIATPQFSFAGSRATRKHKRIKEEARPAETRLLPSTSLVSRSAKESAYDSGKVSAIISDDTVLVAIPLIAARLSGSGVCIHVRGALYFKAYWLVSNGEPEAMAVMKIAEDAMCPMLNPGDYVLLDRSQQRLVVGGFYAIALDGEIIVRQIIKKPGLIVLSASNKDREPIEINIDEFDHTAVVVGKILWWCHECS